MTVRAKVLCSSVTRRQTSVYDPEISGSRQAFVFDARFFPVAGDTEENKRFFASTPGGDIQLTTMREELFEPGKSYYLDFIPVEG